MTEDTQTPMQRDASLDRLSDPDHPFDLLIIGGGATGLGCAVDAAARGYCVALLEQSDFAKATSSRSTKLVHGGVRYLQQGNISLVLEALRERGRLRANAPHLVHDLPFVVPNYDWWEAPFYGIGLRVYDLLAGRHGFGRSEHLSLEKTLQHIPTIEQHRLRGGVIYHDGQFDDARLAVHLARTAADHGGALANYTRVTALRREAGQVRGVVAHDLETDREFQVKAKAVINATGVFTDALRRQDDPDAPAMIAPSQGVHVVLPRKFLPGDAAIMVPHTDDGRVLFAIPWHGRTVVGTTDTPVDRIDLEPRALPEELDFLLTHAARYLAKDPTRDDVLSVFAGLRPLVNKGGDGQTKSLSRDHHLSVSDAGLITIAGGKWTTYRKMAQDTIDQAAQVAGLEKRDCPTRELRLHGHPAPGSDAPASVTPGSSAPARPNALSHHGNDAPQLRQLIDADPALGEPLHPDLPALAVEVVWAARHEMARTVEDVLARRTRSLLLDARASLDAAERVAELLAGELGRDAAWQREQIKAYRALAAGYLPDDTAQPIDG